MTLLYDQVWEKTRCFVKDICQERDASAHGPIHAVAVARVAETILIKDYSQKSNLFHVCTIAVALIHDVKDHKYPDPDGSVDKKLRAFLFNLGLVGHEGKNLTDTLMLIADHVSYSKENNAIVAGTPLDFKAILNTPNLPDASEIRDIVSDADKLEALGRGGACRLVQHTSHHFQEKHGKKPTHAELDAIMERHSQEKLLRLKDHFIKTEHGKSLAIIAHSEFVKTLKIFKDVLPEELRNYIQ